MLSSLQKQRLTDHSVRADLVGKRLTVLCTIKNSLSIFFFLALFNLEWYLQVMSGDTSYSLLTKSN